MMAYFATPESALAGLADVRPVRPRSVLPHAGHCISAHGMDGDLRDFYQRLRERDKLDKVAVIALARKLRMCLNAVASRGTPWVEQHSNYILSYQADRV